MSAAWQVWQPASYFPGEERPEPVLVSAMRFFNAGGGAAVALVARRTANLSGCEFLRGRAPDGW